MCVLEAALGIAVVRHPNSKKPGCVKEVSIQVNYFIKYYFLILNILNYFIMCLFNNNSYILYRSWNILGMT